MSTRVEQLPRSGVREAMQLALERDDALRLDVGDPDFNTPAHIVDAAARAAADGFTHYGPSNGLADLRALIADKVSEKNAIACSPEQVVVTSGGCGALFLTFLSLLDPGDEVLLPDPGWPHYVSMARAVGGTPTRYRLDQARGFEPDLDELQSRIGPRTRAIVLNSPGNPTGALLPRAILEAVLELAARHRLWVISDECYDELVLEGEHVSTAAVGEARRVVTVFSFSKTYAMTGWRVGYAVAPPGLATLLAHVQEPVVSCPSTVAQKAAEAALTGTQGAVDEMRRAYRSRRDRALTELDARGVQYIRPRSAFYALVEIGRSGESSVDFARRLLEEERVAVVPGSAFGPGGEGMVRLSFAASDSAVSAGVERLARAVGRSAVEI